MIRVKIESKDGGKQLLLEMSGHANDGKDGAIICSAASTLAYTLAQNVRDMEQVGKLKKPAKITLSDGSARIFCMPRAEHVPIATVYFHAIKRGFDLLVANYPDYVQLNAENI